MIKIGIFAVVAGISTNALADMNCLFGMVNGGQESYFSHMRVPESGAVSSSTKRNGFYFKVSCDLHNQPNKLELTIIDPQGLSQSTSSENELKLLDNSGDGAMIRCSRQ